MDMKKYVGTKFIDATPEIKEGKEGYKVIYEDGYQSWSPKDVFEKAYRELGSDLPSLLTDLMVFPSDVPTIGVYQDKDYGGAHQYKIQECAGFSDGKTQYVDSYQVLHFVKKEADGSMTPGLQSEQILLALIDRHKKLNARFPSPFNDDMIAGMENAVDAMVRRVESRIERGVMGELKD